MDWDARLYDQNHDFVAAYGENLWACCQMAWVLLLTLAAAQVR